MTTYLQQYIGQVSADLVWTKNGGVLPTPTDTQVQVFQNGQLLTPVTQYTISGSVITILPVVHTSGSNYLVYAQVASITGTGVGVDCLATIVGLDRNPCPCYQDDRPNDYNSSDSGYYLTDPEFGVPFRDGVLANADCTQSNIWDVLDNARTIAINDFETDMVEALRARKERSFAAWNGVIGEPKANRSKTISRTHAGLVIKPQKRFRSQKLVITALYLGIDFTGDVDVYLNSNAFGFTELTETVSAVSGQFVKHTLSTPWELDLYQAEISELSYTITYAVGGNTVRDNRMWCHCGSRPSWEKTVTVFDYAKDSVTDDFEGYYAVGSTGNGLSLEAHTYCDDLAWICELDQLGGKSVKSLAGRAIQYKSSVKLLSQMLEGGQVNQFTLLATEDTFDRMVFFQERYNEIISYIAQELPTGYSGCFGCDKDSLKIAPIVA